MKRRLLRIVLPLVIGLLVVGAIAYSATMLVGSHYERMSRQEISGLIGLLLESDPEINRQDLLRTLQNNQQQANSDRIEAGEDFLRRYGYLPNELVLSSTLYFWRGMFLISLVTVVGFAIVVAAYFWLVDWLRQRHVKRLVNYLQDLNNHIYNLRLDENREDELSLLTNELYKITVTLKEAAEQNHAKKQGLEDALADISHQLRTPLTSSRIMIDNIYDDPDMPPEIRQDFLRSISHQIEIMSTLVTTLLNLAKFDNGSIQLNNQTIKVEQLLYNIQQNIAVLADVHDIVLQVAGNLTSEINLDIRWQTEALTNIVKNCIEHSPSGGTVNIFVEDCPLFLKIIISDHGEGITPTDLKHIFERFYKAQNSSSSGVGIGLAFAKTVIEAGNGQVSVSSQVGEGTKFSVVYFK